MDTHGQALSDTPGVLCNGTIDLSGECKFGVHAHSFLYEGIHCGDLQLSADVAIMVLHAHPEGADACRHGGCISVEF